MQELDRIVPDTSVIIEGLLSKKIQKKELKVSSILIHEASLAELEHQANKSREIGHMGLDELKKLKDLSTQFNFEVKYLGHRPKASEIRYASLGEIDSLIRELAYIEDATLITGDKVQYKVAQSKGIKVIFLKPEIIRKKLSIEKYFDEHTMSVHIRENIPVYAKRGLPGSWDFVELSKEKLNADQIEDIAKELTEEAKIRRDGFIEIERQSSTIIQLGTYRIVIVRPPFSDGWEITLVKPIRKMELKDYNLDQELLKRIDKGAEGLLIAGSPGMGKSTMAAALSEYFAQKNKIVKTIEAPRDLQLSDHITQYAISYGTPQEIHDILLLSRPDYVVFDEMRDTRDFKLYSDLRLSGIGMLGVLHATTPIDSIQRFIGRIEVGMIPSILDTIIFIHSGTVSKAMTLKMSVKVPTGMMEADLARPVIEIKDFKTKELLYEIYSYGEETVVIPTGQVDKKSSKVQTLAKKELERELKKVTDDFKVEFLSDSKIALYVPETQMAKIIGKQGKNISELEDHLGLSIDVMELKEPSKNSIDFEVLESRKAIILKTKKDYSRRIVNIFIDQKLIFSNKLSKHSEILINRKSSIGKVLQEALDQNKKIEVFL